MAGRHVIKNGRVLAVSAVAHMRADPLAREYLEGFGGEPDIDLSASEAIDAVVMGAGIDVIIDPDPTDAPFAELVNLDSKDFSAGRWTSSSNCGRVTPSRRMGRASLRRANRVSLRGA
jgi:hypothetical protein